MLTVSKASLFTVNASSGLCFPQILDCLLHSCLQNTDRTSGTQNSIWVPLFHIQKCVRNKRPQGLSMGYTLVSLYNQLFLSFRNGFKQRCHWNLK